MYCLKSKQNIKDNIKTPHKGHVFMRSKSITVSKVYVINVYKMRICKNKIVLDNCLINVGEVIEQSTGEVSISD